MRWTSSQFRYNERESSLPAGPADGSRNVRRAAMQIHEADLISGNDTQLFCWWAAVEGMWLGARFQLRAEAGPLLAIRLSLRDEDDGGRRRLSG
jgi:hypothetical protein